MQDEILTTQETAKLLRISKSTFWKLVRTERLNTVKISDRKTGVWRSELNRFMGTLR